MSKSKRSARRPQSEESVRLQLGAYRIDGSEGLVGLLPDETGIWIVTGWHPASGNRVVFLQAVPTGDEAMERSKAAAAELDPFSDESEWQFAVEFYECDTVLEQQHAADPTEFDQIHPEWLPDDSSDRDDASVPWPPVHMVDREIRST